jgi:tripartite-type tricarboxylate transporter receptor subunit TctC
VAPAGTPPEIIVKLRDSYLTAIRDDVIKKKLTDAGIDVLQSTPEEFADYMRSETRRWAALIKSADIHAD